MATSETVRSAEPAEKSPASPALSARVRHHKGGLRRVQELAMERLCAGGSIVEAAGAAGVDRRTVYRWISADPQFAAAYNAWRKEAVASGQARVLGMSDLALQTLRTALEQGDARVALQVVRSLGLMEPPHAGPTDPVEFGRLQKLRNHRANFRLMLAEDSMNRELGEGDDGLLNDVERMEEHLAYILKRRRMALAAETPEKRSERLDPKRYRGKLVRPVARLLQLIDAETTDQDYDPYARPAPPSAEGSDLGVPAAAPAATPPTGVQPADPPPAATATVAVAVAARAIRPIDGPPIAKAAPSQSAMVRRRPRYEPDPPDPLDGFEWTDL